MYYYSDYAEPNTNLSATNAQIYFKADAPIAGRAAIKTKRIATLRSLMKGRGVGRR